MRNSGYIAVVAAIIGAPILAASLGGCDVEKSRGTAALEAQGMTGILIGSHAWLGCDRNDFFSSKFQAIGANGKPISGVLCQGVFKGITVRID